MMDKNFLVLRCYYLITMTLLYFNLKPKLWAYMIKIILRASHISAYLLMSNQAELENRSEFRIATALME